MPAAWGVGPLSRIRWLVMRPPSRGGVADPPGKDPDKEKN